MQGGAAGAGFALATAGIQGLGGAIEGLKAGAIGLNSTLQTAGIGFTAFAGSAGRADALLGQLQEHAATSAGSFEDAVKGARRFAAGFDAMGGSVEQVIPLMRDVNTINQAFGVQAGSINRVNIALGQMLATGRVQSDEMNQLAEAGINAWGILAQASGKSVAELRKQAELGKITTAEFVNAMHQYAQRPELAALAERMNQSFDVASSNVRDRLQQLTATGFKPFFDGLTGFTNATATALNTPAIRNFAADIGATLQDLGRGFDPLKRGWEETQRLLETGDLGAAAARGLQAITDQIQATARGAFGGGQSIVAELAGGLLAGANQFITDAAETVATLIANFLGHSMPTDGPLVGVSAGGASVAEAWASGFAGVDIVAPVRGQVQGVSDVLGNVGRGLSLQGAESALAGAVGNLSRLRDVGEDAEGVLRGINEALRDNEREGNRLQGAARDITEAFAAQRQEVEGQLEGLRDQNELLERQQDIAKRIRDLQQSQEEERLKGDPVARAQLENRREEIDAQIASLRNQNQIEELARQQANQGKDREKQQGRNLDLENRIAALTGQRLQVENQLAGMVDREGLARLRVQRVQDQQADRAREIADAQEDLVREMQRAPLEQRLREIGRAEREILDPIKRAQELNRRTREDLQATARDWQDIKGKATDAIQAITRAESERKAAEKAAGAKAGAPGGPGVTGLGTTINLPTQAIEENARKAGERAGESLMGGIEAKVKEVGPSLIGGAIGAAAGAAVLGPVGMVAGGLFGARFVESLREKVPNIGDLLRDKLTLSKDAVATFAQALQGDWKPPGVDEWVDPFVRKVGEAGLAIRTFGQEVQGATGSPEFQANLDKVARNLADIRLEADKLAAKQQGTQGPQGGFGAWITERFNRELLTLSGTGANVLDLVNTIAEAFPRLGRIVGMNAEILGKFFTGDFFGAKNLADQLRPEGERIVGEIGDLFAQWYERAWGRIAQATPNLHRQVRDDWARVPRIAAEALATLPEGVEGPVLTAGTVMQAVLERATTQAGQQFLEVNISAQDALNPLPTIVQAATGPAAATMERDTATMAASASQHFLEVNTAVQQTLPEVPRVVETNMQAAATANETSLNAVVSVTEDRWGTVIENVRDASAEIPKEVQKQQQPTTTAAEGVGQGVIDGLNAKLTDGSKTVWDTIGGVVQGLIDRAKQTLGIKSPSAEFQTIGEQMWEGLQTGFVTSVERGTNALLAPIEALVERVKGTVGGLFGGGNAPAISGGGDIASAAIANNIDPRLLEAFARHETGNFSSQLYQQARNIFSIKGTGPAGSVTMPAWEVINGQNVTSNETFRKYNSDAEAIQDFLNLISTSPRYADAWANRSDPAAFMQGLQSGGYATDPNWATNVLRGMRPTGPQGPGGMEAFAPLPLNVSQMQAGLPLQVAKSFCGPYALALFMNSVGRTPTMQEAQQLGQQFGWRPGVGMTNAALFDDMVGAGLQQFGVPGVSVQQDVTPTAAEAVQMGAQGSPVTFNTPAHYFVSQGFNAATNKFRVGATGTVLGGQAEMSFEQISALGGGITQLVSLVRDTLPQAVQQGAQQVPQALQPITTGLQALSTQVATMPDQLGNLQRGLLGLFSAGGVQGAGQELANFVAGTTSGDVALANVADTLADTNPQVADYLHQLRSGAIAADQFALALLNMAHAQEQAGQSFQQVNVPSADGGVAPGTVASPEIKLPDFGPAQQAFSQASVDIISAAAGAFRDAGLGAFAEAGASIASAAAEQFSDSGSSQFRKAVREAVADIRDELAAGLAEAIIASFQDILTRTGG